MGVAATWSLHCDTAAWDWILLAIMDTLWMYLGGTDAALPKFGTRRADVQSPDVWMGYLFTL